MVDVGLRSSLAVSALFFLVRCGVPAAITTDGGELPGPAVPDSGTHDSGTPDAATEVPDSGAPDAGVPDGGAPQADGGRRYDADGPVPYTTSVERVSNAGRSFDVTVYLPMTPGKHPVVGIFSGSSQMAPAYAGYATRLASHGIAAVVRDDPGALVQTTVIVADAEYLYGTWLPATLGTKVDVGKLGLAGHSRGGGASLLTAQRLKGKVAAWCGLDPVDNQFVISPGAYARTDLPNIGIPTAYLGAEVISNCAPAADGYEMLYGRSPSPSLEIEGIGAGHTQFQDLNLCNLCSICSPNGTANAAVVLAYAQRYFTAFFARELLGDASLGARLEGAGSTADVAAGLIRVRSK